MSVERMPRRAVLIAILTIPLAACDWFTDFKRQPKIDPWEAYTFDSVPKFRGQPAMSVPTTGSFAPGFVFSYQAMPGTVDSMSSVANPTAVSEVSVENGRKHYQINCAVCHGPGGNGNGAATRYGFASINIITAMTVNRTDGYLFGIIRNGRGMMPSYNRIEEMDRWDVVNYIRALQGRGGAPADTTAPGVPGETGDKLPGATRLGPTVPSHFQRQQPPPDSARRDSTAVPDSVRRGTAGGAR